MMAPIARFLCLFTAIFSVLMLPWFGLANGYTAAFRAMGTWLFSSGQGSREVTFVDSPHTDARPTFARIEIANRKLLNPDGSGPVRVLDLDARGLGWQPTALLTALTLASPLPWRRRLTALGWGLFWVQVVVMGFLGFAIWNESSEIGLVAMSPFWKNLASGWQRNFITQFSLAAPLAIWMVLAFRTGDLALWRGKNRGTLR